MKRFLSLCLVFCLSYSLSAQVVSIRPASSIPGQTLTTVITLATGVMQSASAPNQTNDIYLRQGGTTIICDYFDNTQVYPGSGGNSDSLWCNFTIPANATLGWYEVHVTTYWPNPIPPFLGIPTDNLLAYAMVVSDPNACPVPFNTTATAITSSGAQINWDPATVADTFRVRYRSLVGGQYLYKDVNGGGGTVSTTLSNLYPGINYTFEVSTKCLGYSSAYSIIDTFQTVSSPANCIVPNQLNTSGVSASSATLSWNTLVVADSFLVRYSLNGTTNYLYKYVVGGGSNTTTISGLAAGRAYQFQVTSICLGVSSGYSVSFIFNTPGVCVKPHGLTATSITTSSAVIGWSPLVSGNNFRVRYTVNGTSNYKYKTVAGTVYSTSITGLIPGTTYNYQVSTICGGAGTGYSGVSSFTTTSGPVSCIVPFGISSSNLTSSTARINWSVNVVADTFRIRYRLNGAGAYVYKNINGPGGITNGTITGLLPSSLYTYQVSSVCLGVSSGYSSTLNFTTISGAIACGIPTGVSSSAITSSTAQINWNNTVTADTFRLRYAENGTSSYYYKDVAGGAGYSTVISGLSPTTTYDVQVSSICLGVGSGYSSVHTFSTIPGTIPCATPYDLSTSGISQNTATIIWTPDVTADSFMVRYSVLGTTNYKWKKITGTGGVFSTTLTGLTNNTSYQWQVRSICNGVSVSVYSASYSFSTILRIAKPSTASADIGLLIYPNPASKYFNLHFNAEENARCHFYLFDMAGRMVYNVDFESATGENLKEIKTSGLSQGIYTGILESGLSKNQVRIIIQ